MRGDSAVSEGRSIEWPTIGLIAMAYVVIGALVWNHDLLPWWVLPAGSWFAALHVSLQHETLHGQGTTWIARPDDMLGLHDLSRRSSAKPRQYNNLESGAPHGIN